MLFPGLFFLRFQEGLQLPRIEDTAAVAAVACDPVVAGGESDHASSAVVPASAADQSVDLREGKIMQSLKTDKGGRRLCTGGFFHSGMSGADGSHKAGIWRADDLTSYILFDSAQDCIIAEGSSLYHDPVTQ